MPFCGNASVIESRHWKNAESGRTFSPYSSWVEPGSVLVSTGFDIAWDGDGTEGRCKPPFATRAEAEAFAADWNAKRAARYAAAGMELGK